MTSRMADRCHVPIGVSAYCGLPQLHSWHHSPGHCEAEHDDFHHTFRSRPESIAELAARHGIHPTPSNIEVNLVAPPTMNEDG